MDVTLLVVGFAYSDGGVLTDNTSPIQDLQAKVQTPSLGVGYTFSLLGQTAQDFAALPYSWAQASALVAGQPQSTTRSGFSDSRFRFSVLLVGAPAVTVAEFATVPRQTVLGTSLTVVAPTGQ